VIPEKLALTAEAGRRDPDEAHPKDIEGYTMEAGVRTLQEKIEAVFRAISAWTETRGEKAPGVVDERTSRNIIGVRPTARPR